MVQIMFQMQLLFMTGALLLLISRPLLAKLPKAISYVLWCILFLRLLCPFSLDTDTALLPMQNIMDLAEQKQQIGAMWGTLEQGTEDGRMQREAGSAMDQSEQDGIEKAEKQNREEVSRQNHAENAPQSDAGETAANAGQLDMGNYANGGRHSSDIADSIALATAEDENDTKQSEAQGTSGYRYQVKDVAANTAGGLARIMQLVECKIGMAVTNILAILYRWMEDHVFFLAGIWGLGMVAYLFWSLHAVRKYGQYVDQATLCPGSRRVYESEQVSSPFVYGICHKKIIVPHGLPEAEREYIVCHEEMHLRRGDDLIKWIVYLLNGIYWFQPMVWVAAYYLEQDMEMSCDEMVLRKMGHQIKKVYAQSLLSFAEGRTQEMLPPAFASGSVKSRIRNVLQPRHFRKWMIPISVILVLSFVAILFTVQRNGAGKNAGPMQESTQAAAETTPTATADRSDEEMLDSDEIEGNREKAIIKNFGKFYTKDDSISDYETYFINRYKKYRIEDEKLWKDKKGNWRYPKEYEFSFVPSNPACMAAQQFPPGLLEDMDTEELLSFILSGDKNVIWGWCAYDNYLMGLAMYYSSYNYIHELMNREDCAAVVHQKYQGYTEDEVRKYSKSYWAEHYGLESQDTINFRLVEGLEWFFMALEGKKVPDEYTYGLELEKTLDDPMPPQEYVFREDVTHDGVKDTITLHMEALRDESLATGEEETVTVTSGKTGEKIASYTADTIHYGWNGIYLYKDQTGTYLVEWKPMMYQGVGAFSLRVFSLKEDGTEEVLIKKKFDFNLNSNKIDFDQEAYRDYIDFVNSYLKNSYVIVDTDQGEVMYSTKEGQLRAPYDGSWVIDDYKEINRGEPKD